MGASIFSGALTTIASTFMLMFCSIQIFFKFGTIITVNIALSILFTFFYFTSLLAIAGPVGNQGSCVYCVKWCISKIRRRSSAQYEKVGVVNRESM